MFEIDGNTVDSNGDPLPDDWNSIAAGAGHNHASATTGIVEDLVPAVFRGGSKDINDISTWVFDLGSSPPKDDMLHAYAAAYPFPNASGGSDLVIYSGADRAVFNGTASLGFWFFKGTVVRNDATGTFEDGSGSPAHHIDGDVLVAFEYTNGGGVSTARIFKWQSGALVEVSAGAIGGTGTGTYCNAADTICAETNASPAILPWNGTVEPGQLFEMGINISQAVGGGACFSSFMATSRSSSTPNAQLKNFVLSAFPVCKVTLGKACVVDATSPKINPDGASVHTKFSVPAKNDGFGPIFAVALQETFAFGANDSCKITAIDGVAQSPAIAFGDKNSKPIVAVKSELAANATVDVTVECDTVGYPMVNSVKATAKSFSSMTTPDLSATHTTGTSETCSPNVTPGLKLTKACNGNVTINGLSPNVCVDISVQNTGSEKLTSVTVSDDKLGSIYSGDLAPGEVKSFTKKCYTPSAQDDPTNTDTSQVKFSDTVSGSGIGVLSQQKVTATPAKATCNLCPTCPACPPAP